MVTTSGLKKGFSVLIADGETDLALFATHCMARYPGVRIHVLSSERWPPIRFSRYCHSFTFERMGQDDEARLRAVEGVVKKARIDVLMPADTDWMSFVVHNRKALSKFVAVVPVPEPRSFEVANNKGLLAQFLQEKSIPIPPTTQVTFDEAFDRRVRQMEFPVLLKPVSSRGGDGIIRFDNLLDLLRHMQQQDRERTEGQFIVQSFLPGPTVGIDFLSRDGAILAVTIHTGISPNMGEYGPPGAVCYFKEDRFVAIVEKVVSALRWNGYANLDALCDSRDGQLKVLEINARFWGSLRGCLAAGISYPYLACLVALKAPFETPEYGHIRYYHTAAALREGVLKLAGRAGAEGLALEETGVKFLLDDPAAEGLRAVRERLAREKLVV